MKYLLIVLSVLIPIFSGTPNTVPDNGQRLKEFLITLEKERLYELTIAEIKHAEGLRLKIYRCPAGQRTIGYGHCLLRGEKFNEITEEQADSLLRIDFQKRLDYLPETMPWNQRLAIAKFIFNIGIGAYNRSALRNKILHQEPIDNLIVRYCHYRVNGKYVRSNWLLKQRQFELKLYNYQI